MLTPTSRLESSGLVLILGGRSWVGYRISAQLVKQGWSVLCTSSSADISKLNTVSSAITFVASASIASSVELIKKYKPAVVINLLIGITDNDFAMHQAIAAESEKHDALYVYASSALALDGYDSQPLVETLPPLSVSEYGIFKGRCEQDLKSRDGLRSLILRFSSIHGWSPYKDSRTVVLLKRVAAGEIIKVNRGVLQNRLSDIMLAQTIASLIEKKATGVAHIGAADKSEEIDFLKRLVEAFGFDANCILADQERAVNLVVVPNLGLHPEGSKMEADTVKYLLTLEQLQQYKFSEC